MRVWASVGDAAQATANARTSVADRMAFPSLAAYCAGEPITR
jgi:hypothetical protein